MNFGQLFAFGWLGINYIPCIITVSLYRGINWIFDANQYTDNFATKKYIAENTAIIVLWFLALPVLPFYSGYLLFNKIANLCQ